MDKNYRPDILNCMANLSSDEVFTSPKVVNEMLDLFPEELWSNPNITFLDPACKTGVFLREIAKRLIEGLKPIYPDLQDRVNYIMKKQLYGIGITDLTALMTRRTLYCSRIANGTYSIAQKSFDTKYGNIYFERIEHTWKNGKCKICGASQYTMDRDNNLETYAYPFIHKDIKEIFGDMKFDVIITNPPYQLRDGGAAASAMPLYHKFIQQAKKLNPKYITMIVPARWYSGGKGLDRFRIEMLSDKRMSILHDFVNPRDCFPNVEVKGGICYFLWDKKHNGDCEVHNHNHGVESIKKRPLLEENMDTFIRYNNAVSIYQKVKSKEEKSFSKIVSARKPYGLPSNFSKFSDMKSPKETIKIYANKKVGFISEDKLVQNKEWVNKYKIYISESYGAGEGFPHQIINKPFLGELNTCCTETYLVVGPFDSKEEAENTISYMKTKFFRFMVMLKKITQHATSKVYECTPIQNPKERWNDNKLYEKYNLSQNEISFIESMIKPME